MLTAPDFSDRVTAKILLMTQPYREGSSSELKAFFFFPLPSLNFLGCDVEMLFGEEMCIIQRVDSHSIRIK